MRFAQLTKPSCDDSHLTPERLGQLQKLYPHTFAEYKARIFIQMSCRWIGTDMEPFTIPMLAMLYQEDSTLSAERRHDCKGKTCLAVGIQGHHICHRGALRGTTNEGKRYCYWKAGKSPMQQFEADYPEFSHDLWVQFDYYTEILRGYFFEEHLTVNQAIQRWNPKERNRRNRVRQWEKLVELSIR